jgi:DNA-binding NtrC family response regulator
MNRPAVTPYREALREFQRAYFSRVLIAARGNVAQAARLAGRERTYLWTLLKTIGLSK